MQKYDETLDVFFISGHYHNGLNANSITNDGTVYFIDTPFYGGPGTGFHVELYDNEIIFRARDFTQGKWVSEYDRTIELIGGSCKQYIKNPCHLCGASSYGK